MGNIPKLMTRADIIQEVEHHACKFLEPFLLVQSEFKIFPDGLVDAIIYSSPDSQDNNRGFCFLEYESNKAAILAKR